MPKTRTPTRKLNFTKRTLQTLPIQLDSKRLTVFDEHTPGLGFTVFPTGVRSFFHLRFLRGYPKRTTIGRFPELSIEQARSEASALNSAFATWKHRNYTGPIPFRAKQEPTLEYLANEYTDKYLRLHAARPDMAAKNIEWQMKKYLAPWRNRKLGSISKDDVRDLHRRLGTEHGKTSANRIVQMLRAIFYWAEKVEIWDGKNPAAGIGLFREAKRTRFLQPDELPSFFAALAEEKNLDLRDFVNLAIWTGARRGDVFSMRWENIHLADNRWNVPDPKNRNPYQVSLTPEAIAILKGRKHKMEGGPWVFPSRGKTGHLVDLKSAWRKLLKRAGLDDKNLRQHDLRRTLGSYQAAQGTTLNIIGKSLGHLSIEATQVYAQLNMAPVRASVMEATRTIIAASKKKIRPPQVLRGKPLLVKLGQP